MVTQLFKTFFVTNAALEKAPINFSKVLSQEIQNLYFDYYSRGSGMSIFLIFLGLMVFTGIFAKNTVLQWWMRIIVVITAFLWSIGESKMYLNTEVPLNKLFLPVPKFSIVLYFILFFISVLFGFLFMKKKLQQKVQRKVLLFVNAAMILLVLLFFLPLWTGELWYE